MNRIKPPNGLMHDTDIAASVPKDWSWSTF